MTAAKAVKGEHSRVAVCGECAPLLWAQGNAEAAIRVEELWNEIAKTYYVDILCGYPLGSFQAGKDSYIFNKSVQHIQLFIPGEREQVVLSGIRYPWPILPFHPAILGAMLFCREKHARRDGLLPKNRPSTHWPPDFRYPVIFDSDR